jgi:hypothetical protein
MFQREELISSAVSPTVFLLVIWTATILQIQSFSESAIFTEEKNEGLVCVLNVICGHRSILKRVCFGGLSVRLSENVLAG